MRKKTSLLIAILCVISAGVSRAQTVTGAPAFAVFLPNGHYQWVTLGTSLKIVNGVLEAVVPASASVTRKLDVVLVYDPVAMGWKVPAGATNVSAKVNGLTYSRDEFAISNGILKAVFSNMQPDHKVMIDYDLVNP